MTTFRTGPNRKFPLELLFRHWTDLVNSFHPLRPWSTKDHIVTFSPSPLTHVLDPLLYLGATWLGGNESHRRHHTISKLGILQNHGHVIIFFFHEAAYFHFLSSLQFCGIRLISSIYCNFWQCTMYTCMSKLLAFINAQDMVNVPCRETYLLNNLFPPSPVSWWAIPVHTICSIISNTVTIIITISVIWLWSRRIHIINQSIKLL